MADEKITLTSVTENPPLTQHDLTRLKETLFAGMTKLNHKIEALRSNSGLNQYHSEKIGSLALALSKAQGEFEFALNGKKVDVGSYSYNYAELIDLIKASRKALSKYELAITQDIIPDQGNKKALLTILMHSSGEWIKSLIPLEADTQKSRSKDQAEGGTVTFWKRYTYSSIIGLASADEADLNLFEEEEVKPKPSNTKVTEFANMIASKKSNPGSY